MRSPPQALGAAHVVGVDISVQMTTLAKQQEHAQPLGIEYHVADASVLGKIGAFDRVTASYFLHYAQSREQLLQMVRTVYDNLKPGQLFVASNLNPQQPPQPLIDHGQYGLTLRLMDEPLRAWSTIRVTLLLGAKTVEFDIYWTPWATYEDAFRTVGFRAWKMEPSRRCSRLGYTHAFYATLPLWNALLWSTLALTMEGKVHTPRKR